MRQYVCCGAQGHHLAIEVLAVREIVGLTVITPVPHSPRQVRGLINLRGRIISVLDLAVCAGEEHTEQGDDSRIVVLRTAAEMEQIRSREQRDDLLVPEELIGLLIDSLGDIVAVEENVIEAPPANFSLSGLEFIDAVFSSGNVLHSVINVNKLLEAVTATTNA